MSEKLFCLGMPKTGTTSLAYALDILGYKVLHDNQVVERITENLSLGYTDIIFADYNAFLDFPHPGRVLDNVISIPDSKIIYTTRLSDREWINSCLVHVLHSRLTGENSWNEIDTNGLLREKLDLESRICDLPNHKWMSFDVTAGWKPLCQFLSKPIPTVNFPKVNQSLDRLREIFHYYEARDSISYV